MVDAVDEAFQVAVERATSRSAILSSLKSTYGASKSSDCIKSGEIVAEAQSHSNDHRFIDVLLDMTGNKTEKLKKLLEESIFTKAIVLENSTSQNEAMRAKEKRFACFCILHCCVHQIAGKFLDN
jgi:hypothetical protein